MGALTKAILAAGLIGGGAPLAMTAYDTYQDKKRYDALKERLSSQLPSIALAGIGGALAGGGAAYAAGKLRNGTYAMRPSEDGKLGKVKNMAKALTGRTGVEGTPDYEAMIANKPRQGLKNLMRAKVHLPEGAQLPDLYRGVFDVDPEKALVFGPGAAFKHAGYGDLKFLSDKLAASVPGALLTAGGLAAGGALLDRLAFRPWQESNRRKLDLADTASQYAVPAAALVGALVGGGGGYLAGKSAGKKQRNRLAQDVYNATASEYLDRTLDQHMNNVTGYGQRRVLRAGDE